MADETAFVDARADRDETATAINRVVSNIRGGTLVPTGVTLALNGTGSAIYEAIQARSTDDAYYVWLSLGREADELALGVAANNGDFVTGAGAGDSVLTSAAEDVFIGAEASGKTIQLVSTYTKISAKLGVAVTPSYTLHAEASVNGDFLVKLNNTHNGATSRGVWIECASTTATAAAFLIQTNATNRFTVWCDGGVSTGGDASPGVGGLRLNGILYLGGSTTNPFRRRDLTVANAGTSQLHPTTAAAAGYFRIRDDENWLATFACEGGGTPRLADGSASRWTVTSGTASRTNVYYTGGTLTIQNNTGASRTYRIDIWGD